MDPSWEWFFVPPSFGVRETPGHKLHHYCPHAVDIYQNRSWKHDWMPMVQTWIQRQTNDDHQLVMTAYIEMISTLLNRIRAMFNATSSCLVSMDAAYSHPSTQHPHWIKHIYHHLNQLGSTDQQWHTCRKQKKTKKKVWFGRQCPFSLLVWLSGSIGWATLPRSTIWFFDVLLRSGKHRLSDCTYSPNVPLLLLTNRATWTPKISKAW